MRLFRLIRIEYIIKMSFDIVIPLGPNEISRINQQIQHVKKNVIGYRNIYVVSVNPNISLDGCIIIDEKQFEFKINDYGLNLSSKKNNLKINK